jgi:hypothetical protein
MTNFGPDAAAAVQFVQEGQNRFLDKADVTLEQAIQHVTALSNFTTTGTEFSVDFNFTGHLTPFVRPPVPVIDASEFALRPQPEADLPPEFVSQTPDIGEQPIFDVVTPSIVFGDKPVDPVIPTPVAPPRPAAPVIPAEPDYARYIPEPVSLLQLNLPTFTALQLPEFQSTRPTIAAFDVDQDFQFTPEAYVSALLTKIQGRVSTWMDGQEALPIAIRRAIVDRGRGQVVTETEAEVESIYDEFGSRGFSQPPGMLAARVDAARQKGQDRVADFNREAMLKEFDEALANMRLAVTSGIQLEGVTINLHLEEQRLLLQSAQFLRETSIAVLNARISQFNAEMQGYGIDAQVLESRIKAELSKLEEIRLRLEGEQLKGAINEQTTRQYEAQWSAVKTLADFYASRIAAVKIEADANLIPIQIFSEECKAFGTLWDAQAKRWDGYRASIEGEVAKTTLHRNLVDAYAARVSGAVQFGGLKLDQEKLRIAEHQQNLETYGKKLQRLDSLLSTERARLAAVGQRAGAEAAIYSARSGVEQAASAATDRSFQLGLEEAKSRVDTQLEAARIRSSENVSLQGLSLEALKAIAQILSQLAASTMSAVNYGANVSASQNYGYEHSIGFSGDADDWTGPTYF